MFPLSFQLDGATYHCQLQTFGGGVGRNMADGLSKIHGTTHLITKLGSDQVMLSHSVVLLKY